MRKRTRSREYTLQFLYQLELTKGKEESHEHPIQEFWQQLEVSHPRDVISDDVKDFATRLVALVTEKKDDIDRLIESCAEHWKMNRMAVVDRNILRLGTCEILYCEDIPTKVAINESIELAKKFGDLESSRFVNGILDQVAKKHALGTR